MINAEEIAAATISDYNLYITTAYNGVWYFSLALLFNMETHGRPDVFVFPNPASEVITVLENEKPTDAKFCLYDLSGKNALDKAVTGDDTSIDVRNLEAGIYIYNVFTEKSVFSGKVVLQ